VLPALPRAIWRAGSTGSSAWVPGLTAESAGPFGLFWQRFAGPAPHTRAVPATPSPAPTAISTSQLSRQLAMSLAGTSTHLAILRQADLVTRARAGRTVL